MNSNNQPLRDSQAPVQVNVHGVIGTVVLHRPGRRNALDRSVLQELELALDDLHQQRRVRGVILTGKGDCFCAGADLHDVHARSQEDDAEQQWFQDSLAYKDLLEVMLRFPKPIVAAVNGPALGAGAALVLASDLAVGTPTAVLGFPDTQRGLVPGLAVPLLQFRGGGAAAANLLLRGEPASAESCRQLGLFADVVDHDLLWARAEQIVREVARGAPAAVAMTKRLLNETVGEQLGTWLSAAAAAMASARTTEAATEGVAAFLEKRQPDWP